MAWWSVKGTAIGKSTVEEGVLLFTESDSFTSKCLFTLVSMI